MKLSRDSEYSEKMARSLPAWGVRVEIVTSPDARLNGWSSLPAWGVRVEISVKALLLGIVKVTPRMGSAG